MLLASRRCARFQPSLLACRFAHTLPKHTIFLPAGSDDSAVAQTTLPAGSNPTAFIFGWVGSREKVLRKYTTLYTKRGVDVLAVMLKPEHVYKPVSLGRRTTETIVDALTAANTIERPLLIQGFSAGAYMYGNLLTTLDARGSAGLAFTKRIKGFIFDSPVDIDGVPFGLSRAIFGNESEGTIRQRLVEAVLATCLSPRLPMRQYYQASSDAMHGKTFAAGFSSPIPVPAAFLYSDADSVTISKDIRAVTGKWRAVGADVEVSIARSSRAASYAPDYAARVS
jgi:hypothetical protein